MSHYDQFRGEPLIAFPLEDYVLNIKEEMHQLRKEVENLKRDYIFNINKKDKDKLKKELDLLREDIEALKISNHL